MTIVLSQISISVEGRFEFVVTHNAMIGFYQNDVVAQIPQSIVGDMNRRRISSDENAITMGTSIVVVYTFDHRHKQFMNQVSSDNKITAR